MKTKKKNAKELQMKILEMFTLSGALRDCIVDIVQLGHEEEIHNKIGELLSGRGKVSVEYKFKPKKKS